MLSPKVYAKIYHLIKKLPDFDIVEIGGAAGASGVTIAKSMKDSGKKSKLIVIEKCEGGSRNDFGNYRSNLKKITNNFKKFKLLDRIILFPKEITFENRKEVLKKVSSQQIAAFIHDADGHLERDFFIFYPILIDNGLIIVDDYQNKKDFRPISQRYPQGGMKKIITYKLLKKIIEWGLFEKSYMIGTTIFGYKPPKSDFHKFNLKECKEIINEIKKEHGRLYRHVDA